MDGKSWNTMDGPEKLDWLRSRVEDLAQQFAVTNDSLTRSMNRALGELEKMIKTVAEDVSDLKKQSDDS
jgi:hypothetical protein